MKKLIIIGVVLAAAFTANTAQAGIFSWGNNCYPVQPAPVAAAPATVTTARVENGYRAFSYQPATVAAPVAGYATVRPQISTGFHDAGWKARGF